MIYRFGTFEFDALEGALRRQGRAVPLEPKPARALALLVERAGELVSREELRGHLWEAGTHVDFDRALAYCVGQIRQALGDSADNPRFVQTIPRRGFKFISPVSSNGALPGAHADRVASAAAPPMQDMEIATGSDITPSETNFMASPIRRPLGITVAIALPLAIAALAWTIAQSRTAAAAPIVAVALFDNETGDAGFDLPLSRMTDGLVQRLTALGPERVGVVGNHALLRQPRPQRDLAAIGRETAATWVVLVQLQRRAPDLSLLLQLIRLSDGVHVWVQRTPLTPATIDAVDEQVAARIERAVRRHVLGEPIEAP